MLLMTMFMVALAGILLAAAGRVWHASAIRDKEAQLLFVGGEFARALARYKAATPPGMPPLPERLEQLLLDNRQQVQQRHLRRLYRDPLTDSLEWGLIREGGRIAGVYSLGTGVPIKQANFPAWAKNFVAATSYAGWKFAADGGLFGFATQAGNGASEASSTGPNSASAQGTSPADAGAGGATPADGPDCKTPYLEVLAQCNAIVAIHERAKCKRSEVDDYWLCRGS